MNSNIQKDHAWYNNQWFQKMAPVYDVIEIFARRIREDVAETSFPAHAKVLDMACGTGSQSIALAKRGYSVVGVDLSPDMLERAKKKIRAGWNVTFLNQDASHIPYQDSYFDAAVIDFGLHDMPEEVGLSILKEMKRTTKPDGKIVIVDYHVPENRLSFSVVHAIASIWESRYYHQFLERGLESYLGKVGLQPQSKRMYLLGNLQSVMCLNAK